MVVIKGVRGSTHPPPFLTKMRQMVEDPNTNSIISWNSTGTSFIIWDHLIFSKDILPQYFRHNNFSSFIYQLNNYGFKKIGLRQYEYENKWFQSGKEDLIINISRRNESPLVTKRRRHSQKHPLDTVQTTRADLHSLRSNVCRMKSELGSLKDKTQDFQIHLVQSHQKIRQTETQTRKLLNLLAQTCSPCFAQQITKHVEEQEVEELTGLLVSRQTDEIPSKNMSEIKCNQEGVDLKMQDEKLGGDSTEDFDGRIIWKKILDMREEDPFVCENEDVLQVHPYQPSRINHFEFDNLLDSKMVVQVGDVMEDDVMFELWE